MIDQIVLFIFLAIAVALIAAIIALPTVIAFFINRWLTKKGIKYVGLFLLIIAPVWTAYEVYTAIYPTDSYYFEEFKEVTLREAPKSAKVKKKDASYPNFQGDYCSASLIAVSKEDYQLLLTELTNDLRITKDNHYREFISSPQVDKVIGSLKREQIIHTFTRTIAGQEDHHLYIGFLDDNQTIIVRVCIT